MQQSECINSQKAKLLNTIFRHEGAKISKNLFYKKVSKLAVLLIYKFSLS